MKARDAYRKLVSADKLIDCFVEKINTSPRETLRPDEVPPSLRVGPPDKYGWYDWRIERRNDIDWITPLEALLPGPLPPAFRSLVTRYVYPEFEAGDVWFFANTRNGTWHQWRWEFEPKGILAPELAAAGYIQFARPWEPQNYDALCFDTRRRAEDGDCPIVWIDHERVFCDHRVRITREFAPSFRAWVQEFLAGGK